MGTTSLFSKFLIYTGTSLIAFFSPIMWAIWCSIALIVIDTITGVMKGAKADVKGFQSKKLGNILYKVIYYGCALIIANILSLYIDAQVPFVKLVFIAVVIIEVKSIDENFRDTFGFSFVDKIVESLKFIKRK